MSEPPLQITPPPTCRNPKRRIRSLVAVLLACCAVPVVDAFVPWAEAWMPLSWALSTPPIGVILTLSFWIGLGNATLFVRLMSGAVGAVYIIAALVTVDALQNLLSEYEPSTTTSDLVAQAFVTLAALTLFGGVFMVLSRWWALLPASAPDAMVVPKSQFSIFYILLLTAGAAVVFTLVRLSRDTGGESAATYCLAFIALATNALCASFAALRPAPIVRSCVLALLVAYVLGGVLSLGLGDDLESWRPFALGPIYSVLPTAILLGSLLVVRSTGYRLLRKSAISASTTQPQASNS